MDNDINKLRFLNSDEHNALLMRIYLRATDIDKTGCQEYATHNGRYLHKSISTKYGVFLVHRVVYVLLKDIIPSGMFICHHCDNPPCINIDHLFLGTHSDNMRDAAIKGRKSISRYDKLSTIVLYMNNGYDLPYIARILSISSYAMDEYISRIYPNQL